MIVQFVSLKLKFKHIIIYIWFIHLKKSNRDVSKQQGQEKIVKSVNVANVRFCTVLLWNEWVTYNLGKLVERTKGKKILVIRTKKIKLPNEFMVTLFLRRVAISYLIKSLKVEPSRIDVHKLLIFNPKIKQPEIRD